MTCSSLSKNFDNQVFDYFATNSEESAKELLANNRNHMLHSFGQLFIFPQLNSKRDTAVY